MSSLHERIKKETAATHEDLENLPFSLALRNQTLPRQPVIQFLRNLLVMNEALESAIQSSPDPRLKPFLKNYALKVPLIKSDLARFESQTSSSVATANSFESKVRNHAHEPMYLVGALYVLEGSQNGAMMLKSLYSKALSVEPEALFYFGCYGSQTGPVWKSFVDALNQLEANESEAAHVALGAVETFESIAEILKALYR